MHKLRLPTTPWFAWKTPPIARLLRLSNSLPAAFLVLLGAVWAAGWPPDWRAWLAALAMWLITSFGYVSNDLADIAEDRINKPDRPLITGSITTKSARRLQMTLLSGALLVSACLGWLALLVAMSILGLLALYNWRLKSMAGLGNVLIGLLAGLTVVTGAVAVDGLGIAALKTTAIPALLLSCFIVAREMIKTLEDTAGDQAAGKQTIALALGSQPVLVLTIGAALFLLGLALLATWQLGYSLTFGLVLTAGVVVPLFYTVGHLWRDPAPAQVRHCLALLKASYFFGILALLIA